MRAPVAVDDLYRIRHSAAHVLAQAVQHLFPDAKMTIGPATEEGFYYDFDRDTPFTPDDLKALEAEMAKCIKARSEIEGREVTLEQARELFAGNPYKLELIEEIAGKGEPITVYEHADFTDLCRGEHVRRISEIRAFKLLHTAGAYWRGSEKNKMLQRVYGTAFGSKDELAAYLERIEEARKRDHRRLGRELGLFMVSPLVGSGLPLWLPKGAILRETLVEFMREQQRLRGYQPVITPHLTKRELFEASGHWQAYRESLFPTMKDEEGAEFVLKPVNCPFHIQIYANEKRSYRELPIRYAEFGTVYRYEQSGELGGLTRVRGFTQDDSHIFCRTDQLVSEFHGVVELIMLVLGRLKLEFRARVGLRDPNNPEKYVGSAEVWEQSQSALLEAVRQLEMPHEVVEGEAAIYGPKLDFLVRDAIGREWQLGTVQVDYVLPERFQLEYTGEDGQPHRPVMIHRAPFGSLERFIGVLIEHFAGAFPLWLSPVHAVIIPIADRHAEYVAQVRDQLAAGGLRVEVDLRGDRMQSKIRDAQLQKIPYMLIVGDKEAAAEAVAVRSRDRGDLGPIPVTDFLAQAQSELTA
ncbi:MAG: threonine--tRNA ligase [Actinomycetota bacterium]